MALRTNSDIITEVLVRNNRTTTDAFITDSTIQGWLKDAHTWAAAYKKWPMTEGKNSTTAASGVTSPEGYITISYPEGYNADSIRLITVGGKRTLKKNFYKFQSYFEDNPNDTTKLYTDFSRVIYVNPNAASLSGTWVAWGQLNVPTLDDTDPNATTVFSYAEEDGNDAIVEKVLSYALVREKSPVGIQRGKIISASSLHAQNADAILLDIWTRIQEEQAMYQDTLDEGMYKRFDVLRGGFKEDIFKRDQWSY